MPEPDNYAQRSVLFICGMHRSGTSLLARIFNLLGVSLEKKLVTADQYNNKGYWESESLVYINEEILHTLNSSWFDISDIEPNKLIQLARGSLGQQAISFLTNELANNPATLLKDPRLNRLMPFWLDVCQQLNLEINIVLAVRHPTEVIRSLHRRDDFPDNYGYCLWLSNLLTVLKDCHEQHVEVISYHQVLDNWTSALASARQTYSNMLPTKGSERLNEIADFINPDMHHFQHQNNTEDDPLALLAKDLFEQLVTHHLDESHYQHIAQRYDDHLGAHKAVLAWFNANLNKARQSKHELRQSRIENNLYKKVFRLSRQLNRFAKGRPVLVWGAGGGGEKTIWLLQQLGYTIEAIIDSDPAKSGNCLMDIGITSPQELRHYENPYVVIGSMYVPEISSDLTKNGFETEQDFIANPLFHYPLDVLTGLLELAREESVNHGLNRAWLKPTYSGYLTSLEREAEPNDVKLAIHLNAELLGNNQTLIQRLKSIPFQLDLFLWTHQKHEVPNELHALKNIQAIKYIGQVSTPIETLLSLSHDDYSVVGFFVTPSNSGHLERITLTTDLERLLPISTEKNTITDLLHPILTKQSGFLTTGEIYGVRGLINDLSTEIMPSSAYFWCSSEMLQQAHMKLDKPGNEETHSKSDYYQLWSSLSELTEGYILQDDLLSRPGNTFEEQHDFSETISANKPKILSYYLPQFQEIPENNAWHGEGFTEWTKVTAATPLFDGHYQQHVPHPDLGYYRLDTPETLTKQLVMMHKSGVYGQVFYHYWFSGRLILEQPAQMLLANTDIGMPFCFCWANENWTKAWDGNQQDVLLEQTYSKSDAVEFMEYLLPFFKDDRYLTIDNRPVLFIYRPDSINCLDDYLQAWEQVCEANNVAAPFCVATLTRGAKSPDDYQMDAGVERVLHDWTDGQVQDINIRQNYFTDFHGSILDYAEVSSFYQQQNQARGFSYFRSIVPIWDNSARHEQRAYLVHNSSPEIFQQWLENAIEYTRLFQPEEQQYLLVNAWNEWAEGAHLEPDTRYGYAYLNSIGRALSGQPYQITETLAEAELLSSSLCISFSHGVIERLKTDFALQSQIVRQLAICNSDKQFDYHCLHSDLAELLDIPLLGDIPDNAQVLHFNAPLLPDTDCLKRMMEALQADKNSVICANIVNDMNQPSSSQRNISQSLNLSEQGLLLYQIAGSDIYQRAVKQCSRAVAMEFAEASKNAHDVTTVIRIHNRGDFTQLRSALMCLAVMQDCLVTPLITTQNLSQAQKGELSVTLNNIAFSENCKPVIKHFTDDPQKDIREKMLHQALSEVTTRYLCFLDYDDILFPHAYTWLVHRLNKTGKAIAFGRVYETYFNEAENQVISRQTTFEFGQSYDDFFAKNFIPIHSFMLDLSQLDLSRLRSGGGMKFLEDYYLTLQLFDRHNADWRGLSQNVYIGDYIHSVDSAQTLAITNSEQRDKILADPIYHDCEQKIAALKLEIERA